jgi:hypothetical protein
MSSRGPGNPDAAPPEQVSDLWARLGGGDADAFARECFVFYFQNRNDARRVHDFFFGTPVRTRHSETILATYERLLESARAAAGSIIGRSSGAAASASTRSCAT